MFTKLNLLSNSFKRPEPQESAPVVQPLPERAWNPEWSREQWWNQFTGFVQNACDYDVQSLLTLHSKRQQVIDAARDLADDMISEYEDRWRE